MDSYSHPSQSIFKIIPLEDDEEEEVEEDDDDRLYLFKISSRVSKGTLMPCLYVCNRGVALPLSKSGSIITYPLLPLQPANKILILSDKLFNWIFFFAISQFLG